MKDRIQSKETVTLEVYNPAGVTEQVQYHAPRLDNLAGKTICELSNGRWGDIRIFALIRDLLKKRFPDAKFIPLHEFPVGTEQIDKESTTDLVVQKGCQAVVIGNAA